MKLDLNSTKFLKIFFLTALIILVIIVLSVVAIVLGITLTKELNEKEECGVEFASQNVKIIGGVEAVPNSWPSTAFILFNYTFLIEFNSVVYRFNKVSYCGGSLINKNTVLTAAHCYIDQVSFMIGSNMYNYKVKPNYFNPTIESMYTVYLGLYNSKGIFDTASSIEPGLEFKISSFILHPNYNSSNNLNDIGIIKLKNEAILSKYIQLACLPEVENYPNEVNLTVWAVGWGYLNIEGSRSEKLNNVNLTLYDGAFCNNVLKEIKKDWNKQICAGEYLGGKDTCYGDSGGPLFVKGFKNQKTKHILIGITSYGYECALPKYPGIYTKVSAYLNWISDNLN